MTNTTMIQAKHQSPDPDTVRDARKAAGLTQKAAAELVYVSVVAWQRYEAGTRKIHPAMWELWKSKAKRQKRRAEAGL